MQLHPTQTSNYLTLISDVLVTKVLDNTPPWLKNGNEMLDFRQLFTLAKPGQAPVPLMLFRLNLKFDQNLECSSIEYGNGSQRNFAHITTVSLSWCVHNFIVLGKVNFKPEHGKFWSNFELDRNIGSGTSTRQPPRPSWHWNHDTWISVSSAFYINVSLTYFNENQYVPCI